MQREIAINGLYNIRDIGGLPSGSGSVVARNQFFRSDSPHAIDSTGQQQLMLIGVRTVIDLRYENERARLPNPLANLSDMSYHNIPLMVDGAIEHNAEDLTHLGAFYRYLLNNSQPAFAQVFETMAEQPTGVLFHCQVGKDRTGVVAALLLELAGTPSEHIVDDYVATAKHIEPLLPELRKHRPERINSEQYERLLDARAEFMHEFLRELQLTYGSAEQYLTHIGVNSTRIHALRAKLTN
ncbi:MAG: hypothetical protein RI985_830 [Chloroflexota bacterium]|jgi:protein-tyrosine phosphatase